MQLGEKGLFFNLQKYKPNMNNNLFGEFQQVTKDDWVRQAIKDLKGKDFEKELVSKTLDGIQVQPFYAKEDLEGLDLVKSYQNQINPKSHVPGLPPRNWSNVFSVKVKDEKSDNSEILDALQNGSDALLLYLAGDENLDELLKGVGLEYIQIFLQPVRDALKVAKSFVQWLVKNNHLPDGIHGGLLFDFYAELLVKKRAFNGIVSDAKSLMGILKPYPGFKAFSINYAHYHNAGASAVQELSFGTGAYIDLLDALTESGISVHELFENTILHTAVGSSYFEEVSKLRAMRIIFHQLGLLYGVNIQPEEIVIFSETSSWSKSPFDVNTNMLRNTTEAMSAILGGTSALLVRPHDEVNGQENSFSKRMARNISNIIREESYLDKVIDPVAGSYYLESLTFEILKMVKMKLEEIEVKGGWSEMYLSNSIQQEVKAIRKSRQESILEGTKVKIGSNKYRLKEEESTTFASEVSADQDWMLLASRETFLLESSKSLKS